MSATEQCAGGSTLTPLQVRVLLATAALSSSVGLVLELMLVTQASYLLGDAALATGVVIGSFLAAMGLGAWLSQFITGGAQPQQALLRSFLLVELCLAPLCLLAPLALFALFSADGPVWLALVVFTLLVGVLGGMEVPLLTRLLETQQHLRKALARVLALDYFGALVGSLLFPLLLLPWFGLLPTAALLALIPLANSALLCWLFPVCRRWRWPLTIAWPLAALGASLVVPLGDRIEDSLYDDPVVGRQQTRHQRIVLTRRSNDLRLFLDGNLQFSSLDEYRTFYGRLLGRLAPDGLLVTQASTPFFAPKVMASIQATLAELHLQNRPYSVDVPSFGPWGFVIAHRPGLSLNARALPFRGRWIDDAQLQRLFSLPRDLQPPANQTVLPNRLSRPVLADYQRQGIWRQN